MLHMDIVDGRTVGQSDNYMLSLRGGGALKRMSNAPLHVLAQAAVVAAYKLLDH